MIRPGSTASAQRPWIPALGIVIALLVCIGLMVHVTSIDAHTATAVSAAASADLQTVVFADSPPVESEMTSAVGALELCVFLGVMCALMLLVVRLITGLPLRSDHRAVAQRSPLRESFSVMSSGLTFRPALAAPLRV